MKFVFQSSINRQSWSSALLIDPQNTTKQGQFLKKFSCESVGPQEDIVCEELVYLGPA